MASNFLTVIVVSALVAGTALLYMAPVLVGWARHVPDIGAVAVINLLLGWTLIGWVVALAMALRSVPQPQPPVQFVQNLPPAAPAPQPPAGWAGPAGPSRRPEAPPLTLAPRPQDVADPASLGDERDPQDWPAPWGPAERG
jgi:hypothetical protein